MNITTEKKLETLENQLNLMQTELERMRAVNEIQESGT